jgi:hypothetical protein
LALKDVLDDPQDKAVDDQSNASNTPRFVASTIFGSDFVPSPEQTYSQQTSPRAITHSDCIGPILNDQNAFGHYSGNDNTDTSSSQQPDTILDNTLRIDPSLPYEQPSIHTTSSSPVAEDNEEGQYAYFQPGVRDDLLSPVEISPLNLSGFGTRSMDITTINRDDTQRPPSVLARSPPRSPCPTSTFDLLASPFGSPGVRVLSPRLSAFIGRRSIVSDPGINNCDDSDSTLDSPRARRLSEVVKFSEPSPFVPDVAVGVPDSSAPNQVPGSSHEAIDTVAAEGRCSEMKEVDGNEGFENGLVEDGVRAQADLEEDSEVVEEDKPFSSAPQPPVDSHETVTGDGHRRSIQREARRDSSISHQAASQSLRSHQTYSCGNEATVKLSNIPDVEQSGSAHSIPNSPGNGPVEGFSPVTDVLPGDCTSNLGLSHSPATQEPAFESQAGEENKSPRVEQDYDDSRNKQISSPGDGPVKAFSPIIDVIPEDCTSNLGLSHSPATQEPAFESQAGEENKSPKVEQDYDDSRNTQISSPGNGPVEAFSPVTDVLPGDSTSNLGLSHSPAIQEPAFESQAGEEKKSSKVEQDYDDSRNTQTSSPGNGPVEAFSPVTDVLPGDSTSNLGLSHSPATQEPAFESQAGEEKESPKDEQDCDDSSNPQISSLDFTSGNQSGPFVSLYEAYSERSSSPPQESSLIEARPVDPTLGESSSISTPLSSAPDGVFTSPSPERQSQMIGAPIDLGSPDHSRPSFSSRRSNRLSSPFTLRSEDRNIAQEVDDFSSPTSTNGSRKIPFGWRRSSTSVRQSIFHLLHLLI